jgi:hypothetical protein
MPRTHTFPNTGDIVWYYAASPPATAPQAAVITATVSQASQGVGGPPPVYNLAVFDPALGTLAPAASCPFYYGSRPASGAWCTMRRVNENAPGSWPTQLEATEYADHDLNAEQKEAVAAARIEQMKKEAANYPSPPAQSGPHLGTDTTTGLSAVGATITSWSFMDEEDPQLQNPRSSSPHTASRNTRRGR